jgi:hypothetical protein
LVHGIIADDHTEEEIQTLFHLLRFAGTRAPAPPRGGGGGCAGRLRGPFTGDRPKTPDHPLVRML